MNPVDIVALILTTSIGATLMLTAIVPLVLKQSISDNRSKTLARVTIMILTIISLYVGSKLNQDSEDLKFLEKEKATILSEELNKKG